MCLIYVGKNPLAYQKIYCVSNIRGKNSVSLSENIFCVSSTWKNRFIYVYVGKFPLGLQMTSLLHGYVCQVVWLLSKRNYLVNY